MKPYKIDYVVNKHRAGSTVISAPTLTQAYLEFMVRYPEEYEIVDIKAKED